MCFLPAISDFLLFHFQFLDTFSFCWFQFSSSRKDLSAGGRKVRWNVRSCEEVSVHSFSKVPAAFIFLRGTPRFPNQMTQKKMPSSRGKKLLSICYFFLSLRAGGILQILISSERGRFLRSCPLTQAESFTASFTSLLFVNEQKPWFLNHFSFKTCAINSIS